MISLDFLNRIAKMREEARNRRLLATGSSIKPVGSSVTGSTFTSSIGTRPAATTSTRPVDVNTVVYDPKTGKAYPNPSAARAAGVMSFSHNMPSGIKIDWSYWDRFKKPPEPPVKLDDITPSSLEVPFELTKATKRTRPGASGGASGGGGGGDDDGPKAIDYTNTSAAYWKDIAANRADEVWIPNLEKTGHAQTVGAVAKAAGVRAVKGSNYASNDPGKTRKEIVVARRDRMGKLPGKPGYDPNTFESDR